MGRRKKEPESAHREKIAAAAQRLFSQKGVEAATMDDIAKAAGYSKATLYVYFADKEEMVGYLVLKSMKMLSACVTGAVSKAAATKEKYDGICMALMQYQQQYPLYFSLTLGKINVDFEKKESLPVERETFEVGEQINGEMKRFLEEGIRAGEIRADIPVLRTVFLLWSALAGLIQMAAAKQDYIEKSMQLTGQQFLKFGFEQLFRLVAPEVAK